jgi:autotransporter passenger strand-loop-strand repeat protein
MPLTDRGVTIAKTVDIGTETVSSGCTSSNTVVSSGGSLVVSSTTPKDSALIAVSWSQDGRFLFAGGAWRSDGTNPVRRWSDMGRGAFIDIHAASQTILEIRSLKYGSILVAEEGFRLIGPDAKVIQLQGPGELMLQGGRGPLRVSTDGAAVQIDSWSPVRTYRFALARRAIDVDPPADEALFSIVSGSLGI